MVPREPREAHKSESGSRVDAGTLAPHLAARLERGILGAESLALRVLTIFTETARPSAQLVALVKSLIAERDLDARFLIPIIAEMDKVRQFFVNFDVSAADGVC